MIQVVVGPFTHHSAAETFSLEFGILKETKTMYLQTDVSIMEGQFSFALTVSNQTGFTFLLFTF